jgi:hypothetical protein
MVSDEPAGEGMSARSALSGTAGARVPAVGALNMAGRRTFANRFVLQRGLVVVHTMSPKSKRAPGITVSRSTTHRPASHHVAPGIVEFCVVVVMRSGIFFLPGRWESRPRSSPAGGRIQCPFGRRCTIGVVFLNGLLNASNRFML